MFVPAGKAFITGDPMRVNFRFVAKRWTAVTKHGSMNSRFEKRFPSAGGISGLEHELMSSAWNRGLNQKTAVQRPGAVVVCECHVAPYDAEFAGGNPAARASAHCFHSWPLASEAPTSKAQASLPDLPFIWNMHPGEKTGLGSRAKKR